MKFSDEKMKHTEVGPLRLYRRIVWRKQLFISSVETSKMETDEERTGNLLPFAIVSNGAQTFCFAVNPLLLGIGHHRGVVAILFNPHSPAVARRPTN